MTLKEIHPTTPNESINPNNNTYTFVFDNRNEATKLYFFLSKIDGVRSVELTHPTKVVLKLDKLK